MAFEAPVEGLPGTRPGLLSCFLPSPGPKGAIHDIMAQLLAHLLQICTKGFLYEALFCDRPFSDKPVNLPDQIFIQTCRKDLVHGTPQFDFTYMLT